MPTYEVIWTVKFLVDATDEVDALYRLILAVVNHEILPDGPQVTIKELK